MATKRIVSKKSRGTKARERKAEKPIPFQPTNGIERAAERAGIEASDPFSLHAMWTEDIFTTANPENASVPALFMAALSDELAPQCLAEAALARIHDELMMVEAYLTADHEAPLSDEIVATVVRGIAERARVASEVARRINETKRSVTSTNGGVS